MLDLVFRTNVFMYAGLYISSLLDIKNNLANHTNRDDRLSVQITLLHHIVILIRLAQKNLKNTRDTNQVIPFFMLFKKYCNTLI